LKEKNAGKVLFLNALTKSFVFLIVVLFLSPVLSAGTWWDADWDYRKPITVTENSGSELTDFQVLVEFDSLSLVSAGSMESDCGDLRFADESGLSELSYWVESGCNTADTKVWVKVPSIPADGSTDIYMYYGNLNASDAGDESFVFGSSSVAAGKSCTEVRNRGSYVDGVYWIDPDGAGGSSSFQAYCDMASDGGGWTLLMKVDGTKTTFSYDSAYWTNTSLYNSSYLGFDSTEAKLKGFDSVSFDELRVGLKYNNVLNWVKISKTANSLYDLLKSGSYVSISLGRTAWKSLLADSSLQPNCNREGFNVYNDYSRVRVGIISNQENDCNTPDSRIGIGGAGTTCGQDGSNSAGNEARCSADNGNRSIKAFGYLFARSYSLLAANKDLTVTMGLQEQSDTPFVTGVVFDPATPEEGQSVTATAIASDPQGDGTIKDYSFTVKRPDSSVFAGPVTQAGNEYFFTPDVAGYWTVEITATDVENHTSNVYIERLRVTGWWDSDWKYRKSITITDTSGFDLTDFQVPVDITDAIYDNTGLVGSWHFTEGSGTRTVDFSGNGNDGVLRNGLVWTNGKFGSGLKFDGVGSHVGVSDSSSLDVVDAVTVEAWVRLDNVAPLGSSENPWLSCSHIFNNGGSVGNGVYTIDPDGAGGDAAFQVYCDMTTDGGGWTRVNYEDFESSTSGWSATNTITACGSYGKILGGYNVLSTPSNCKTYNLLNIAHNEARVKLDYIKIDSWDVEDAIVRLDGAQVWRETYCFCSQGCANCGGSAVCGGSWNEERKISVDKSVSHFSNTLQLCGDSTIDSAPSDESWGFDNIEVFVRDNSLFESGIGKLNAYGLAFVDSSLKGRINNQSIDAPISTGWSHVVMTYDKNAPSSQFKLYVNGALKTQKTLSESINVNSNDFIIGNHFNGVMDEIKVFNRAISASEVQEYFNAEKARLDLADLRFADISGTQELGYWLENDVKAWVKVPSIPANGSTDVFMYYGNPSAGSASGTDVFELFSKYPNFEGWSDARTSTCGSVSMMGGYNIFGAGASTQNVISGLPAGQYLLEFSYYQIDSWDGEYGRVFWNGDQIWSRQCSGVGCGSSNICGGSWVDYLPTSKFSVVIAHSGGSATLKFDSTLDQAANDESWGVGNISIHKYVSSGLSLVFGGQEQFGAPTVTGILLNFESFEMGDAVIAVATATDPNEDPITKFDFRVLDGIGNEVLNPITQTSSSYSFTAENGEPGLFQVKAKAFDGEYWGPEFTKELFVNDSSLATASLSFSNGVFSNTELSTGKVFLIEGQATGTFTTDVISPVNFSKWGVVTFLKTTPGGSTLTVDVLDASDDSVLIADVKNGQNISETVGSTPIKLRANFTSESTPSLDSWDVSYYSQFKITITDCSNPYSGEVTTEAVRVSDSEEFGPFTGSNGQVFVEVPPGVYNIQACIPANGKCSWKYNVELA